MENASLITVYVENGLTHRVLPSGKAPFFSGNDVFLLMASLEALDWNADLVKIKNIQKMKNKRLQEIFTGYSNQCKAYIAMGIEAQKLLISPRCSVW